MSLIAGSYEKFIWGFKLKPLKHSPDGHTLTLTKLFCYRSHLSPISSVTAAGPVAASGTGDDTVHLYDLTAASSLGSLHHHSATVTALYFYTPSHLLFPRNLLSASADGAVCIFDADPFMNLTIVRVHKKGRVNSLSVHPLGKLALTVGRDECLAMVNLVRGRRSYYCRLGKEASLVGFDLSGERFFMVMGDRAQIPNANMSSSLLFLFSWQTTGRLFQFSYFLKIYIKKIRFGPVRSYVPGTRNRTAQSLVPILGTENRTGPPRTGNRTTSPSPVRFAHPYLTLVSLNDENFMIRVIA